MVSNPPVSPFPPPPRPRCGDLFKKKKGKRKRGWVGFVGGFLVKGMRGGEGWEMMGLELVLVESWGGGLGGMDGWREDEASRGKRERN